MTELIQNCTTFGLFLSLGAYLLGLAVNKRFKSHLTDPLLLALVFSCLFTWLPGLNQVSGGLAIVICTVAAASLCALLFPVKEEEE